MSRNLLLATIDDPKHCIWDIYGLFRLVSSYFFKHPSSMQRLSGYLPEVPTDKNIVIF